MQNLDYSLIMAGSFLILSLSASITLLFRMPWGKWGCKHDYSLEREMPNGVYVFQCGKCGHHVFTPPSFPE
jgi:hypothetical protein